MKRKKILSIALGGGLGGPVLIFTLIMVFAPGIFVKGIIMKNLEKGFGGKARAEAVDFGWKKGVVISELFIQGREDERPILKVESIHLKFAILPLLKGRLVVHRLDVNRPEMVIYRGTPKTPNLDGAPELTSGGESTPEPQNPSTARYTFPEIIKARINDGTFIFINLNTCESTRVENFNLILSGLKPGRTARIDGECDIIGGDGQDHAVISGSVQGFELVRLEALRGKLNFESGFADIHAAIDMSTLNQPGARVLKATISGDSEKTITKLGSILFLPEGMKIQGQLDSQIDAVAQPGGAMLIEGQTSASGLYLKIPPLLRFPLRSTTATLFHRVVINPTEGSANAEKILLRTDNMFIESSGVLQMDGSVQAILHMGAPLEELTLRLTPTYVPLGQLIAVGDFQSDIEIHGTIGQSIHLKGTSRVKELDLESKLFQYADPEVTLYHDLYYNQTESTIQVKDVELASGLMVLNLEQGLIKLRDRGHHQGKLGLLCNLEEIPRWYKLPETIKLKGVGRIYLELSGPIKKPFYRGLTASGTADVEEVVYEDYRATDIVVEQISLKDDHLTARLDMDVNDAPVKATLSIDLATDRAGGPYTTAELHASKIPITHTMKRGRFRGLVTLDVDEASGEGLGWNETLKRTLTARGSIKVEQGRLSASELVSAIFMALGHPGSEYNIDSLTSDFKIQNQRIYTKKLQLKGKPFDMELSGWASFTNEINYDANIFIPKERVGKDIQKIFGFLGEDSTIPLKLTGRLPRPTVQIRSKAVLEGILRGVFKGPEAQKEQPKRHETLFETILKGSTTQPETAPEVQEETTKKPAEEPAETPKEPRDAPKDTERIFKELEDVFKDIFK